MRSEDRVFRAASAPRGAQARRRSAVVALVAIVAGAWAASGCERRTIPARAEAPGLERHLEGGTLVFEDDFEREALGPRWRANDPDWRIVDGWLHSSRTQNKGVWLLEELPEGNVRVEFTARSEPKPDGSFPGDIKWEIFAAEPVHEAGYILINGGWNNSRDVIARLDHHDDDKRVIQAARPLRPSTAYRYAVVRHGDAIAYFRDGEPIMTYVDEDPLPGRYFGFNNWETLAFFDDLRVYALD